MRALRPFAPPVRRREFWATQALVFVIAAAHSVLESVDIHGLEAIEFLPVSLFLIPVVYAALAFGLYGAAPTAIWCAILTVPNVVLWHPGVSMIGELWQAGMIVAVGLLVGQRIDREKRARAEIERREVARQASEQRYRRLFETTADALLLLGEDGRIEEANDAAGSLFGRPPDRLRGAAIATLVGPELGAMLVGDARPRPVRLSPTQDGHVSWIEPALTGFPDDDGGGRLAVLRDVTLQLERQEGLESYTRQSLATREEEGRRIARDLHDGPVQSLVLLWRKLDAIEPLADAAHRSALVEARALAQQIADELRRFSRALRPSLLDDLGLGPAVKAEVAVLGARSPISTRYVETGEPRRLPPESELMLLRIAQEALRNAERHAGARSVVVRLGYRPAAVRLSICDDGKGIQRTRDPLCLLQEGKLGLVGMQERARVAGGELTVTSRRRGGTVVSVVVPIDRDVAWRGGR